MKMKAVRYWLPVVILAVGLAILLIRRDETGLDAWAALWGAGLSVALLNWLHRIGVSGERERDEEDEARRFLEKHGHWPDEPPPARRR
jgi:membrane protein required for beta-lactamase induction